MENLQEKPLPENEELFSVEKKSFFIGKKQFLFIIGGLLGALFIYLLFYLFIIPDRHIQQIYLIPKDAAFIIQTNQPLKDWEKFSKSEPSQALQKSRSLDGMMQHIEFLDSVIRENKMLLSLVGKREMLISIHKIKKDDFDFLLVLDLQKTSKIILLKDQIENLAKLAGFLVTQRAYKGVNIVEMRDPDTRDILYTAFVDNHFIASYTSKLLEASIDAREEPVIGLNTDFIEIEKMVTNKGLFTVYINYENLSDFMGIYFNGDSEYLDIFFNSMTFAGLYLNVDKEKVELKGHTLTKDIADPYVTALMNSGKHRMRAHEIMSARTAFYCNIGFENPVRFIKELEEAMTANNPELYKSYQNSRKKIEVLFDISLDEHFLSWMSGEFAFSQSEPGLLGSEPELILAVRTKSMKQAKKNMQIVEKKIKNKTPIKIKNVTYKEYEVNYVELKDFFRLFFGQLFDKFEKPYYTYIDDYVVFSNKATSLLSFIEDYEQKNLLKNSPEFKRAFSVFNSGSTLFTYIDTYKFYPQLQSFLNFNTWNEVQKNKDVFYSFPTWGMQITGDRKSADVHYRMNYHEYDSKMEENSVPDIDENDSVMNEDATTEKELMNELKRFYVEKFQGNILREYYPEGVLKSESEVKDERRNGRYREYYENGKLKARGKYVKNQPKGTWKYYTEEGKFKEKRKF